MYGGQRKVNYSELIGSRCLPHLSSVNFIPSDIFICSLSFPSTWTLYRVARTSGWNRSGIFTADETFCFKWKRVHRWLFHHSTFPNATYFIFCAVWWPHSGWQWQWNMKEHTCLRAWAAEQPHGCQSSSAVPSKCTHHGSRLYFWQWEINPLVLELFFLISAHSVYKMWIIQEPKKLALWNKLRFEE